MQRQIVYGRTQEKHDFNLRQVLKRLKEHNVCLNKDKCVFSKEQKSFYGYIFSSKGVRPDPCKIKAIKSMGEPTNTSEVRSLLGMIQYVFRFIPGYASIIAPLRSLSWQDILWKWGNEHHEELNKLKSTLTPYSVMAYFDPALVDSCEVIVDASLVRLGALLLRSGKVVNYTSRALSEVEQRYSQTEQEMLAVV